MSNELLFKGSLVHRKLVSARKNAVLCWPTSVESIKTLHTTLLEEETGEPAIGLGFPEGPNSSPTIELLGNLTYAAAYNSPVLVIGNGSNRCFIHLLHTYDILGEADVKQACNFVISTDSGDWRFSCSTSVEYQGWIQSLRQAKDISTGARKEFSPVNLANMRASLQVGRQSLTIMGSPKFTVETKRMSLDATEHRKPIGRIASIFKRENK